MENTYVSAILWVILIIGVYEIPVILLRWTRCKDPAPKSLDGKAKRILSAVCHCNGARKPKVLKARKYPLVCAMCLKRWRKK